MTASRSFTVTVLFELRTAITLSADSVFIQFASVAGRTYRLEYKERLTDESWTRLGTDTIAAASVLTFTNTTAVAFQRFYRVVQAE
jgi:hypothetical protein